MLEKLANDCVNLHGWDFIASGPDLVTHGHCESYLTVQQVLWVSLWTKVWCYTRKRCSCPWESLSPSPLFHGSRWWWRGSGVLSHSSFPAPRASSRESQVPAIHLQVDESILVNEFYVTVSIFPRSVCSHFPPCVKLPRASLKK